MRIVIYSQVKQRTEDGQVNRNFHYKGGGSTTVIITAARKPMNDCGVYFFFFILRTYRDNPLQKLKFSLELTPLEITAHDHWSVVSEAVVRQHKMEEAKYPKKSLTSQFPGDQEEGIRLSISFKRHPQEPNFLPLGSTSKIFHLLHDSANDHRPSLETMGFGRHFSKT